MKQVRQIFDLRNKFTEVETTVTQSTENALDVADKLADGTTVRFTHTEMFEKLREKNVK